MGGTRSRTNLRWLVTHPILLLVLQALGITVVVLFAAVPIGAQLSEEELNWRFEYDGVGRPSRLVDPGGKETSFAYETFPGKPELIQRVIRKFKNGQVAYEFDREGRRILMRDRAGVVRYSYDDLGRLRGVERLNGYRIDYRYDSFGRLKSCSLGPGNEVRYDYDFLGRIAAMHTPAGAVKYDYQTGQGKVIRTLPNGIRTIWDYEPNGELTALTHIDSQGFIVARFSYEYRPDGLVEEIAELSPLGENKVRYGYDQVQRLTSMADSQGRRWRAEYDPFGNRLKLHADDGPAVVYQYDWAGRLAVLHGEACGHDASGNLTRVKLGGASKQYDFDHDNRVARVNQGEVIYEYDGDGYLIARAVSKQRMTFVPDPTADIWQPLLATSADGKKTLYLWEGRHPLGTVENGKPAFFLEDHLDSVRAVVDKAGKATERREYSAFGDWINLPDGTDLLPGFAGLFFDAVASTYVTHGRSYCPELGRFLQVDAQHHVPIGSRDDLSVYAYCWNDPVNFVDINGLSPESRSSRTEWQNTEPWLQTTPAAIGEWLWTKIDPVVGWLLARDTPRSFEDAIKKAIAETPQNGRIPVLITGVANSWEQAQSAAEHHFGTTAVGIRSATGNIGWDMLVAALDQGKGRRTHNLVWHLEYIQQIAHKMRRDDIWLDIRAHSNGGINLRNESQALEGAVKRGLRVSGITTYAVSSTEALGGVCKRLGIPYQSHLRLDDPIVSLTLYPRSFSNYLQEKTGLPRWVADPLAFVDVEAWKVASLVTIGTTLKHHSLGTPSGYQIDPIEHQSRRRTADNAPELGLGPSLSPSVKRRDGNSFPLGGHDPIFSSFHNPALSFFGSHDPLLSGGGGGGAAGLLGGSVGGGPRHDPMLSQFHDPLTSQNRGGPPPSSAGLGGGLAQLGPSPVGGVHLGGAGKSLEALGMLKGVAVDPKTGRWVLLSEADATIDLPPLRLDDLVTIFRSVYELGEAPTVTIDPEERNPYGPTMNIVHGKGTENTYVGWVLFQADRIMKGFSLSTDNETGKPIDTQVPGYREVVDKMFFSEGVSSDPTRGGVWERFWIVPSQVRWFMAASRGLSLLDVPLKVRTQRMIMKGGKLEDDPNGKSSSGAVAFTHWFTANYDAVAGECRLQPPPETGIMRPVPVFTELRRIALITAIAEQLRDQGVSLPAWMRDYQVTAIPFPETTPSLTVSKNNPSGLMATIFGGVNLGAPAKAVQTFAPGAQAKTLPPEERKVVAANLELAAQLVPLVRSSADQTPLASPISVKWQDRSYQAASLPGAETRALASCQLSETDLEAPVDGGYAIALTRRFNSFFSPSGPWGPGWTMDLPQLNEIKIPMERTENATRFKIARELTSPLGDLYVRFSNLAFVAEADTTLPVPDKRCEILALSADKDPLIKQETTAVTFKDGRRWHFDPAGRLTAVQAKPHMTLYVRDSAGWIHQIVGFHGDQVRAVINLKYDAQGRLAAAEAESQGRKTTVSYRYDTNGRLESVENQEGATVYGYDRQLVTAVSWSQRNSDSTLAPPQWRRRIEYNQQGQLVAEAIPGGDQFAYRIERINGGYRLSSVGPTRPEPIESISYDLGLRPLESRSADGTRTRWEYAPDGTVKTEAAYPTGDPVRITVSGDKRRRITEVSRKLSLQEEFDSNGRLLGVQVNQVPLFKQQWRPDGLLQSVDYETHSIVPQYDQQGRLTSVLQAAPPVGGKYYSWQEIELDPQRRSYTIKDSSGGEHIISYDSNGNVSAVVTKREGRDLGFRIDNNARGQIEKLETSWGDQAFNYDAEGSLRQVVLTKRSQTATVDYEAEGERPSVSSSTSRPVRMRNFDGGTWQVFYYGQGEHEGLVRQIQTPNNLALGYEYDSANRLTAANCATDYRIEYAYDTEGRLVGLRQIRKR